MYFIPTFKIAMATNHRPVIQDDSVLKSNRIRVIPFNRHFSDEEQDKNLKSTLTSKEVQSALLNKCLNGYASYESIGLHEPKAVIDATAKYQTATEILELRPKNEWYDYEAKYTKGMTEFVLPAELSEDMTAKVKDCAVKAFEVCGCSGVSRVDFLIVGDIPYILEINTNPGMTDTSDLPAQALACGIDYDNLVLMILNSVGLNK